jgi:hypothetical protein
MDRSQFLHAETIFTCIFWVAKGELSVGKSTNHVILEGNHCWVVFYARKEACVPVKWVVSL